MIARSRRRRKGFITTLIVVVLFALVLLAGGLLRVAWLRHASIRDMERRLQAEWLAESALDRAAARLTADPTYKGETWSIPADRLGGRDEGMVLIEVHTATERPDRKLTHARADYPATGTRRARESRDFTMVVPDATNTERKGDTPR